MAGIFGRLAASVTRFRAHQPAKSEVRTAQRDATRPRLSAEGSIGGFRLFTSHRGGTSAVEFALLAVPFLMLLGVVAESGLVALEQQTLDLALDRGARQLRTGAFQDGADGSDPGQRFRKIVCNGPVVLFPCTGLRLDVSRSASFSTSQPAEPFDRATKTWTFGFGTRFECPLGSDTVTIRVAVPVTRLFQFLDFTGRIMSDRSQMLIATEVFQVEDYESKPC